MTEYCYCWTKQAKECYYNPQCLNCCIADVCAAQPRNNEYKMLPMRFSVLTLVKKYGKPSPPIKNEELIYG